MTREDAAVVLGILASGFPGATLDDATIELWTDELERLEDNNTAVKAVRTIIRSGDKLPSLAQIRATYNSLARDRREDVLKLGEPIRPRVTPEWVQVWSWTREVLKDDRGFPQQVDEEGYSLNGDLMSYEEYELLKEKWVAAGSPKIVVLPTEQVLSPL